VRLGVLGGTFDPIHLGHLIIAEHVMTPLGLQKVLFIPAGQPWLKGEVDVTEARHRLAMVRLATSSNPVFKVSSMEVDRPGPTYTVDTLEALRKETPEPLELFFIMGMDLLQEIGLWQQAARIFDLCSVVAVERPGFREMNPAFLDTIAAGTSRRVHRMQGPLIDISSTQLREDVAHGISIIQHLHHVIIHPSSTSLQIVFSLFPRPYYYYD